VNYNEQKDVADSLKKVSKSQTLRLCFFAPLREIYMMQLK